MPRYEPALGQSVELFRLDRDTYLEEIGVGVLQRRFGRCIECRKQEQEQEQEWRKSHRIDGLG